MVLSWIPGPNTKQINELRGPGGLRPPDGVLARPERSMGM